MYKDYLNYFNNIASDVSEESINKVILCVFDAIVLDKNIFVIGNGGSAANASHFVNDLSKAIYPEAKSKRCKAISLCDNVSLMTAYANDDGYETIFTSQLKNLYVKGKYEYDRENILIAISGSGNSKNIIEAVDWAWHSNEFTTIGFTGFDGGRLKQISELNVHVDKNDMYTVEAIHSMIFHYIIIRLKNLLKEAYAKK